jgi:hypothetical protein
MLNNPEVNKLRTLPCVPIEVSLSLGCLPHEVSSVGPTAHRLPDEVEAMGHWFRVRIMRYEHRMLTARQHRLDGIPGYDKYPKAVQESIDKGIHKATERKEIYEHFRMMHMGYQPNAWTNCYTCVRGMVGFRKSVFQSLIQRMEAMLPKFYFGRMVYRYNDTAVGVLLVKEEGNEDMLYTKLRTVTQLFEAARIYFDQSSISSMEKDFPAVLLVEKNRFSSRQIPASLKVDEVANLHSLFSLTGPMLSMSYWDAYKHSDYGGLRDIFHIFHDALTYHEAAYNTLLKVNSRKRTFSSTY